MKNHLKMTPGRAAVAVVMTIVVAVVVLLVLPANATVSAESCGQWDVPCRADAHQGVIAGLTLIIALIAGLVAVVTLDSTRRATKLAQDLADQAVLRAIASDKAQKARDLERYGLLLTETLYETVHNLRHLAEVLSWKPPAKTAANEYEGCILDAWPALDFRYAERLLEVPYVVRLEKDAPSIRGFLDHVLRNARYVDNQAVAGALPADVRKPVAWMTEHLLRVLVSARYRSPSVEATAKEVLDGLALDEMLNPDAPGALARPAGTTTDTELRDRVRLVKLPSGVDQRVVSTTVACFTAEGTRTQLLDTLGRMDDPPPRPSRPA